MIPADPWAGLGPATIIRGDARNLPLPDNSVDLCITSPPYFALRSYQDGGEHYEGQIGSEPTPDEFVTSLLDATREMIRVTKPTGSIWVNLGDKYAEGQRRLSAHGQPKRPIASHAGSAAQGGRASNPIDERGIAAKSLIGVPWRYALRCIDDLGLILRAEVIWSKPNGLPESVTDRVRRSHEQWFHFTLQPRYFSAVDEIREPHLYGKPNGSAPNSRQGERFTTTGQRPHGSLSDPSVNPLGKLPGSVWEIPTEPLNVPAHLGVDHFAAFPSEWPRRIITGWSPTGVCTACGEGRRPVAVQADEAYAAERARVRANKAKRTEREASLGQTFGGVGSRTNTGGYSNISNGVFRPSYAITGYACACPDTSAPTTPATILDPFGGTGTVAMVARALGRHGISVDLSHDYCRLARWRVAESGGEYKVRSVEKPKVIDQAQASIFDALNLDAS